MEWLVAIVTSVVGTLAGKIPELIIDHVRNRRAAEEQALVDQQASVNQVAEERLETSRQSFAREQHERDLLLERYRLRNAHYPLGLVGRLQHKTPNFRPSVLISPVPAGGRLAGNRVPGLVHEALRGVSAFAKFADLHTGSFVSDNGVPRAITGSVGAEEIGALEFPGQPAIILYFERDGDTLSAFAFLNSLFPTVDGSLGFSLRVASFGWDQAPGARHSLPGDGDLPTWQYINLAAAPQPEDRVVAAVIAWFVLACLDSHWQARGVHDADLLGEVLQAAPDTAQTVPTPPEEPPLGEVFGYRLETELGELIHAGYEPEVAAFTDQQVAVIVELEDSQVALIVTADYPATPPLVLVQSGAEGERLDLDESGWSPDRTLLEIVESLR
ncbi:hypothetical protein GCM10022224_058070 [Nonomuraea antimicrobica]|uniref:Immunity protein Imm1 n=1 Tax=Nonomuraea antimicrobica TaxID=561173 RepID=A0ABP7CB50_9ACTN